MQFLSLTSALLAIGGSPGGTAQAPNVAIVGARIEIGDGRVIESGNIIIQGDRIAAVSADAAVPAGAKIIDGKGLTAYPGFIDAYSSKGLKLPEPKPAGTPPDNRYVAPATMWHGNRRGVRSDLVASKLLDLKSEVEGRRAQGVTTGLLTSGTGLFGGTASLVDFAGEGKVVAPEVFSEVAFRNTAGQGYPGTMFGIVATVRQTLADAGRYARGPKPADKDADAALEGLRPLVTDRVPALFYAATYRDVTRAARVAEEFRLRMVVNGGADAYRIVDVLKARRAAVIVSLDVPDAPSRTPQTGADATPKEILDERYEAWELRMKNAKVLDEAGIPLAFGNLPSFSGNYLAGVRKLVNAGLPRASALKAMTSGAAQILGVADRTGSIEVGKLANLTLMTGDFVAETAAVRRVLVQGTDFEIKEEPKK